MTIHHSRYPRRFFLFTAIRLAGLIFIGWVVKVILPVLVDRLMEGMLQWSYTGVAFCWMVQCGILIVFNQAREYILPIVAPLVKDISKPILLIITLLLSLVKAWIGWQLIRLLINSTDRFSFFIAGQWLILLIALYFIMDIFAPVPGRFSPSTDAPKTAMQAFDASTSKIQDEKKIKKGFPWWVWVVLWVVVFGVLRWVGCF